jgi:hypothetical protein
MSPRRKSWLKAILRSALTTKTAKARTTKAKPAKATKPKSNPKPAPKKPPQRTQVVGVAFRNHAEPPPYRGWDSLKPYFYIWPFPQTPTIGGRVILPTGEGFIVKVGVTPAAVRAEGFTLKTLDTVHRAFTPAENKAAQTKQERDFEAWLNAARRAAGLDTKGRRTKAPKELPEIPPVSGKAKPDVAGEHASTWWRLYKSARDEEESQAFRAIAQHWYTIRDGD